MIRTWIKILIFSIALVFTRQSIAQESVESYGKNRLQFKEFNWRFYATDNFDIYFYNDGEKNARRALNFLEDEFEGITEILGYAPYNKTKIFLYNSITDLQQSNRGIYDKISAIGGQTNFIKSQVEIAYPGTFSEFKNILILKVSRMLINDMMFGGSLSDMFQSSYLLSLPPWFINGAAHYIAYGWSTTMDDYMRDLLEHKKVKKLTRFSGKDATIVGQSIWNFIAENYGVSNISNILNLTRIIRNEENSIANTLGLPFKQFLFDWQSYYKNMADQIDENYISVRDSLKIHRKNKKAVVYKNVEISPNGNYLTYSQNHNGKYRVIVRDLNNGNEETVYKGGYKTINQSPDFDIPILAWQDNTTLAIIITRLGRVNMVMYDLPSESKRRIDLGRFNRIKDFDFSPNGRLAVFSADMSGQNDIFLYSVRRNAIKRITKDIYDDIQPRFIPNSTAIVFSSNRQNDSVRVDDKGLDKISENFNLYLFDLDTTKNAMINITKTVSKDINPIPVGNNIFYRSNQKGIFNIYRYGLSDSIFTQVTNYDMSVKEFDLNRASGRAAFVMIDNGTDFIYVDNNFDFNNNIFTPPTIRQRVIQAKFISDRFSRRKKAYEDQEKNEEEAPEIGLTPSDSIIMDPTTSPDPNQYQYDDLEDTQEPTEESDDDIIDTDNYIFESDIKDEDEEDDDTSDFLENYRRNQRETQVVGPLPYQTRFSADNIVTSWVIDPLLGFGIKIETQMNDILENHQFFGGILATSDIRSGDVFAEYRYLKYLVDYRIRVDRNVFVEDNLALQKYVLNKVELGAALPFNVTTRVGLNPFFAFTKFFELDPDVLRPTPAPPPATISNPTTESTFTYGGIRGEVIFDNTIEHGLNIVEGTKVKLEFAHYQGLNEAEKSFSNVDLDARHYQKIHREIIVATRFKYGRFFGRNSQNYLLGGMDNWLFNDTEISGVSDPLFFETYRDNSDIMFAEFVTPLRGFDYNEFNGENVLLFNAELRWPIIRYFHRGPISSNFLRNLQFVGFYDLGSAWNGGSIVATENSLNSTVIIDENSPFQARIKNFSSPWLASYGTGVRTVLLGYYMKFDVAWPIEDCEVGSPEFYVTLGYDF